MRDEEQPSTCLVCGETATQGTTLRIDSEGVPVWFCSQCLERVESVVNGRADSLLERFIEELTGKAA